MKSRVCLRFPGWEAYPSLEVNASAHMREEAASIRCWVSGGKPWVSSNVTGVRLRVNQPLQVSHTQAASVSTLMGTWNETPSEKSRIWGAWPADPASHTEHLILDTGVPVLPGAVLRARGPRVPQALLPPGTSLHKGARADEAVSALAGAPQILTLPLVTDVMHSPLPSRLGSKGGPPPQEVLDSMLGTWRPREVHWPGHGQPGSGVGLVRPTDAADSR